MVAATINIQRRRGDKIVQSTAGRVGAAQGSPGCQLSKVLHVHCTSVTYITRNHSQAQGGAAHGSPGWQLFSAFQGRRAGSCCSLRIYQIRISSQKYKSPTCNKLRLTWPIGVWLVLLKPKLQLKVFFFTLQITLQSQTTKVGPGCRLKLIQIHK